MERVNRVFRGGAEGVKEVQNYETPATGSRTAMSWFHKDLLGKADKDWVEAKFDSLKVALEAAEMRGEDTKNLAIRAKERAGMPHECNQKDSILRINSTVEGWSKWWRGIMLSFLGVIITVGGSGMYQYLTLSTAVETTRTTIVKLDETVNDIEESQKALKESVELRRISDDQRAVSQIKDIKQAVVQAIIDSKDLPRGAGNVKTH